MLHVILKNFVMGPDSAQCGRPSEQRDMPWNEVAYQAQNNHIREQYGGERASKIENTRNAIHRYYLNPTHM
jgi:hypothetical protein